MEASSTATMNANESKTCESAPDAESYGKLANDSLQNMTVEETKVPMQTGKTLFGNSTAVRSTTSSDGKTDDEVIAKPDSAQTGNGTNVANRNSEPETGPKTPKHRRAKPRTESADATGSAGNSSIVVRSEGPKRRRPSRNRRSRAATPFTPGGVESEGTTTSPQTTPERLARHAPRKRRYAKKMKDNASVETAESQREQEDEKSLESPLANKSKLASENPTKVVEHADRAAASHAAAAASVTPKDEISKPSSPAEAFELKIDYPAFQTSGILEFEPDYLEPLQHPNQTAPPPQELDSQPGRHSTTKSPPVEDDESNKAAPAPKSKGKRVSYKEFLGRRRNRRVLPPLPPLPVAEGGTRPALAIFFEKHGVPFLRNRRPYLQFVALEAGKLEGNSKFDTAALREEFRQAFKEDMEREWPEHEVLRSHIDAYFHRFDGMKVFEDTVFVYNPSHEAMSEFLRLSLAAKWIAQIPEWDIKNWNTSLKEFEEVWSDKNSRTERGKFKDASFYEFDQLLGNIFDDAVGKHMSNEGVTNTSETDAASEPLSESWTLEDYYAILELNEDIQEGLSTIDKTKRKIPKDLHINLFDLLNCFRNPDTSHRPQRFKTVEDLANYSYSHNKVFPRYQAQQSRVANPLLREIGLYHYEKLVAPRQGRRGMGKPRGDLWRKSSATIINEAVKSTAENEGVDDKIGAGENDPPTDEFSQENRPRLGLERGLATDVAESQATPIPEMPVIAAAA